MPDAVELTVDAAWFIADEVGAGSFPWVLAITPPYRDASQRVAFASKQIGELTRLGVMIDGRIEPAVRQWIQTVCHPDRWLELRYVGRAGSPGDMLRGVVAYRGGQTVAGLRNAQLVTFTQLDIDDSSTLVPAVTVGLSGRAPARFDEFALPAQVGARADERLRRGADLSNVMDYLAIPESARPFVRAMFDGPRSYVEVVAGQRNEATSQSTDVGVGVVDTAAGRAVVSPSRAFDGAWISTFAPGTPLAIAEALEGLTATLPGDRWFSSATVARDFTPQES